MIEQGSAVVEAARLDAIRGAGRIGSNGEVRPADARSSPCAAGGLSLSQCLIWPIGALASEAPCWLNPWPIVRKCALALAGLAC